MTWRSGAALSVLLLWVVTPLTLAAQPAQTQDHAPSRLWVAVGGAVTAMRGSCPTCEEAGPYRRGRSVLGSIGFQVNRRVDVGAEVFWSSIGASNPLYATHLDAAVRFRPHSSLGFFLTGGAGMAFVRNWVNDATATPITSKTLSVVMGAGWAVRPAGRVGLRVFGAQHAAAFGDLQTPGSDSQDVLANFWSVGAAIVLR